MTSQPSSTSPSTRLPGECPPRVRRAPDRNGVDGLRVVTVAQRAGLALDHWQREVLFDSLSRDAVTGGWATPRVAVAVPRQNGKGAIIEALEVAFLLGAFTEARLLIHSAHEYKTAQNGFQRLASYFESVPALARAKDEGRAKIGVSTAREFVSVTGADGVTRTIKFLARSKGSGRGFSADILVLDEAQELSDQVWAAILPTVSARPNPLIFLFGTPPDETMNGEVFTRFRESALAGEDPRLAYFEWSPGHDEALDSPDVWAACNPGHPHRITLEAIKDEFLTMDLDTFARERLGRWDGAGGMAVIPEDTWAGLASESDPPGRVMFSVDVSPDRSKASIGVAGFIDGERVMVQVVENRKGTGWVVDRLKSLTERHPNVGVIIDAGGPAASLLPDLKRAKVRRVYTINTREVVQACGAFFDAAMQGRLAHPDQPVLNEALAAARKRPLGDAWAWHRKGRADITPLVAVTFAAFGLISRTRTDKGPRKAVVL